MNITSLITGLNITINESELEFDSNELTKSYGHSATIYFSHILLGIIGNIVCVIGIFGNVISIVVLSKHSMHKLSTYAYLIALSLCDAIGLFFTIIVLLQYAIPPGSTVPKWMIDKYPILLVYVYPVVVTSQTLSVWITLVFTVDRYLYVCKPYLGNKLCTRKRAFTVICSLYILSILYSIPQFFERKYEIVNITNNHLLIFPTLTDFGKSSLYFRIYHVFIYTIFICLIPFLTIAILNTFLIQSIIKSNKRHRNLQPNQITKTKSRTVYTNTKQNGILNSIPMYTALLYKRQSIVERAYRNDVTILLIGLVFVFMICQLPSTILRLITSHNYNIMFTSMYVTLMDISNFLIVLNSTINCLLYVMLGKKFRKEFLRTICPNLFLKKTSTQLYMSYRQQQLLMSTINKKFANHMNGQQSNTNNSNQNGVDPNDNTL